ncbi:MAG: alpha-amylase family glycosyl hydrolase [Bacteroidales bacterium]
MKRILYLPIIAIMLLVSSCNPKGETTNEPTNDDVILHAWSWSFNTIKDNLKDIADAGYTIIQTSPIQNCIESDNGDEPGMQLLGKGRWYYYYQPTEWKIGNYMLGNRDEFKALCDEANKYNIKIIVDVLPNHVANDTAQVTEDMINAVGGKENLFHANGFTPITKWNDRYECTTGQMGGLPDVNTENPDFQYYYMQFVNDVIECGGRGFRYDTAKHVGLPSDPLDEKSKENDFWDVAVGRKPIRDIELCICEDSLFIYGEVLQDKNTKEAEYSEYIGLVASNYGHTIRQILTERTLDSAQIVNWDIPIDPLKIVSWIESHDNYCGENSSEIDDKLIRAAWVMLVARQYGTPLYYSRPDGSSKENKWGNNLGGAKGNDSFKAPEVVAANKFRKAMSGISEKITVSDNKQQMQIERGNKGTAIINIADEEAEISLPSSLADGKYTDKVFGVDFTVADGIISATLQPETAYIIY